MTSDGPAIQTRQPVLRADRVRLLRSWGVRAAALILSVAFVSVPAVVLDAQPAEAAVRNFGFQGGTGAGAGWLGSVLTNDGTMAFCIDPAGFFPSAATGGANLVSSFAGTTSTANPGHNGTRAVSGTDITKLNYALNTFGPGANTNILAAGLAAYVNSITSSLHPGDGVYYYIDIRVTNLANRNAVKAQYQAIKANVEANWYQSPTTNSATVSITMDPHPSAEGTLNVVATPASAPGVATLTNAVFTSTGLTTANVTNGSSLRITGTPPPDGTTYSIGVTASFTAPTTYAQAVNLHYTGSTNQQMQRVISRGPRSTGTFSAAAFVTDPLPNEFEPIVVTAAQNQVLNPGDPVIDRLTATVEDPAFPWRSSTSGPLPVVANGTLYGPFTDPPVQSATVPVGAPVAGTENVTLRGPGDYFTSGSIVVTQSGYYTWVWVIDRANQSGITQPSLPAGYLWEDEFGLAAETAAVTIDASVTTQVDDSEVGLFQPISDEVTVLHDGSTGAWFTELVAAGSFEQVPVTFDGEAYWVPGDVQPALSPAPPTEAIPIGSGTLTVNAAGTYAGPSIASPYAGNGWIVWQWTLDNTSGLFREWSEMFGEPTQMARVLAPELSTSAVAEVALTHPATDTATITGEPMGADAFLSFAAYLQEDGQPAECSADTLVYDSSATPIAVRDPGEYESEEVVFAEVGTYYWIATLVAADSTVIAQGACGDTAEITEVIPPTMTTEAETGIALTDPAHDVAIVAGSSLLDPGSLTFAAYLQEDGQPAECSADTLVFDSSAAPVAVGATGRYQSPPATFDEAGDYFWVATLRSASGQLLAEGACGEPTETTSVLAMSIETVATHLVVLDTMASDTATVTGPTPTGATLEFAAYLQDAAGTVRQCTSGNRVYAGDPIALAGAGEYESAPVRFDRDGLYFWVATAFDRDGNVLWEGVCGELLERTVVISELTHNGVEIVAPLIAAFVLLAAGLLFIVRRRTA